MRKISSESTFLYKRVFPCFWFGFLTLFLVIVVATAVVHRLPTGEIAVFVLAPLFLAAFGFVVFRSVAFDLVDVVLDNRDSLVVKNRGIEVEIPITNILNVNYNGLKNPSRITLTLREPTLLGTSISFSPKFRFLQNSQHPTAEDLIQRMRDV